MDNKEFSMKNLLKLSGIIALAAIIGLSMIGCNNDPEPTVPGAVATFTATPGDTEVVLAWTAPADNGGSAITGYEVTRDNWANKVTKTASQLTHTYTGLTNDTEYIFKVRAVNEKGAGADSEKKATPSAEEQEPEKVILGDFTVSNGDTQKGWCTNGVDDTETDLEIEDLVDAKYLVLELGNAVTGGMQLVFQGDGDGWAWNQFDILGDTGDPITGVEVSEDKKTITIEFSVVFEGWEDFTSGEKAKIIIGYYSTNIASLDLQEAYLLYE